MSARVRPMLPYSALLVGLLVVAYTACATTAHADTGEEYVFPGETVCKPPREAAAVTLPGERFAVTRTTVDQCNAAHEMERKLTQQLLQCSGALAEKTKPEPGWRIAARWAAWGITVSAAFFAGLWVGS